MMTAPFAGHEISRRSLLQFGAAAGFLLGTGALTGCAGPTGLPGADTLTLALNRSLVSLDNKLNQFDAAVTVQRAVRQALTAIGPEIKPVPVLADRFEMTGDTQWTVRLREGIRYSDGSPVTIEDVSTALKMYRQVQGSFVAGFFPEFPTVVPVDGRTFTLESEKPIPILDALMSMILITPAAQNKPEELQTGVGTGPYVVKKFNRGAGTYSLQRNPNYWGEPAAIENVEVRFLPEESSRVIALRSGEVDVIDTITPDSREQLAGLPGVVLKEASSLRLNQIFYNFRKPAGHPLSDVRVRQALSHAVNGEALVKDVMVDSVTQAEGVTPSSLFGYTRTGSYVYNPAKAKQMLKEAGVTDLKLKIIWETGEFPSDTSVMEALVEMFGDIGVAAELQQFEPGGNILAWRQGKAGDWDLLGNGFPSPTGLAITMLQGMYAGTAEKEKTRDTYQGYVVPSVTAKITAASSEVDPVRREKLLAEAQQAVWDTWPCAWAFVPKSVLAHTDRVQGLTLSANNSYPLADVRLES
ncbi:ABC transporter substrate-binding protein [Arthrobacter sp. E918]|uniref:ABC transporter substrate-binding protein n=2 Tax=Arthrobacter mobilis TaxID=2724944 RepID=A0A7X6K6C2_9MICC|nr:ABC transporter substrate-binding protein [Arthrobacter mobilis]